VIEKSGYLQTRWNLYFMIVNYPMTTLSSLVFLFLKDLLDLLEL
jgi:hypothetical protein